MKLWWPLSPTAFKSPGARSVAPPAPTLTAPPSSQREVSGPLLATLKFGIAWGMSHLGESIWGWDEWKEKISGRAATSLGRGDRRFHTSRHKRTLWRSPARKTTRRQALAECSCLGHWESTVGAPSSCGGVTAFNPKPNRPGRNPNTSPPGLPGPGAQGLSAALSRIVPLRLPPILQPEETPCLWDPGSPVWELKAKDPHSRLFYFWRRERGLRVSDVCTCVRVCLSSVCPLPAHSNRGAVQEVVEEQKNSPQRVWFPTLPGSLWRYTSSTQFFFPHCSKQFPIRLSLQTTTKQSTCLTLRGRPGPVLRLFMYLFSIFAF